MTAKPGDFKIFIDTNSADTKKSRLNSSNDLSPLRHKVSKKHRKTY